MVVLVFTVDGTRYGVRGECVVEVVHAAALVPLPDAPAVTEGIFDLRGRIVPVLDLRSRFRHESLALSPEHHFVVFRAGERVAAFRVDHAESVVTVDATQVETLRDVVPRSEYVAGIVRLPDGLVLIHDTATFLDDAESEALDLALAARSAVAEARR